MNNPLDRKMFRQAGMSKQPMGILASSPELMTTAQKAMMSGQPIKAQNAVSVNTEPYNAPYTQANYPLSYVRPQLGLNSPKPTLYGNKPTYGGYRTDKTVARDEAKFRQNQGTQIEGPGIIPVGKTEAKTFKVEPQIIDDFAGYKKGDKFKLEDPVIENEVVKKETTDNKDKINETNEKNLEKDKILKPNLKNVTIDKDALKNKVIPPSQTKNIKQKGEELKIAISESGLAEGDSSSEVTKGNAFDRYIKSIEDYKKRPLNMAELKESAVEQSGFDPDDKSQGAEERKDAFWMSLMKAGLAIASGESSNTMQNVAKGLGFGLESYGKDIKDITAQERENKKEYYSTLRSLVTDEKSAIAAEQALAVQIDAKNAQILSAMTLQDRDLASKELLAQKNRELDEKRLDLNRIVQFKNLDIEVEKLEIASTDMYNKNEINKLNLEINQKQFKKNFNQKQEQLEATIQNNLAKLKQFDVSTTVSLMTKESKQALGAGFGTFNTATGNIDFANDAEEQKHNNFVKKLVLLAHTKKTSPNLKFEEVKSIANVGNVGGVDFNAMKITSEAGKLNAALIWSGQYQEAWENTLKIKSDPSSMDVSYLSATDPRVKEARKSIQEAYINSIRSLANDGFTVNKRK